MRLNDLSGKDLTKLTAAQLDAPLKELRRTLRDLEFIDPQASFGGSPKHGDLFLFSPTHTKVCYTKEEAKQFLQVSMSTIYAMCNSGQKAKGYRIIVYPKGVLDDTEEFMRATRRSQLIFIIEQTDWTAIQLSTLETILDLI